MYTAHAGIELYAEAFEQAGALDRLEASPAFTARIFTAARNTDSVTLVKESWEVPAEMKFGGDVLVPLRRGADKLEVGRLMVDSAFLSGCPAAMPARIGANSIIRFTQLSGACR